MIPFISLYYGGGCSVIVDGNRDIRRRRSAHVLIIQIILLAVFVFVMVQAWVAHFVTHLKCT